MSKAQRAGEWIKTLLIVLLTVSALLLGWRTMLFNDILSSIPFFGSVAELMRGSSGTVETGGSPIKEAARPLCIVITNEDGARFGVRYDTEARNAVYDRISSIMGEALGSATAPSEISEDEWRSALAGLGVYFEYVTPVKLSVLDGWLGARMPETAVDALLRRVVVAIGDERSRIYYQDYNSGLYYGADTASAAGKAQELEIYSPNDAVFAYESGVPGASIAPYMLLTQERYHPEVRAAAAGSSDELLDLTLAAMGHGNETYTTYPEGDSVRRVGTQFRIGVDQRGQVLYRNTEGLTPGDEIYSWGESDLIEQARLIVADTIGSVCGGAEVFFESLEYGTGDSVSVLFAYYIAGGGIYLFEDLYAAKVTITSGVVTEIELNFRNYSFTGEFTRLLPETQALAAAGGEFMLCYSDTGAERLTPSWVVR